MTQLNYNTTNILTGINAENKLKDLQLNFNGLTQACLQGVLSRSNCTDYNTKGGPGFIQWDSTVKALRENFCGRYWNKYEQGGLEGIISSDNNIQIIPSSGNAATGNINQPSSNKNPKGINTIQLIENSQQGSLFYGFPDQIDDDSNKIYVLLYYHNAKELRMELSEPALIRKGKIVAWNERIIITPFEFDGNPIVKNNTTNDDFIDIPVVRKNIS